MTPLPPIWPLHPHRRIDPLPGGLDPHDHHVSRRRDVNFGTDADAEHRGSVGTTAREVNL